MLKAVPKWSVALLLTLFLSGCYIQSHVIPYFIPRSEHEHFLKQVEYIESQGITVVVLGDTIRFVIPTDDFFEADTAELMRCPKAIWAIARIAKATRCRVFVSGHTDEIGSDAHRQKRADDWAFAIASILWEQGVPRERMKVKGYSDRWPIATNHTISGSSNNRRVEVYFRR